MIVSCPKCGKQYTIPPDGTGRSYRCADCRTRLPTAAVAPPPPGSPAPTIIPVPAAPVSTRSEFDLGGEPAGPNRRPITQGSIGDYLLLRRHVTPLLIVVVFWFGTACFLLYGLVLATGAVSSEPDYSERFTAPVTTKGKDIKAVEPPAKSATKFSVMPILSGLAVAVVGPIVLRIYCELLIVVFRINETLTDIRERLPPR